MGQLPVKVFILNIPWAKCLRDPAIFLYAAIAETGRSVSIQCIEPEDYRPDASVDIILGAHAIKGGLPTGSRTVLYETENLVANPGKSRPPTLTTWTYAEALGGQPVPLGYVPALHRRLPPVQKDIDALFVGSMNDRRRAILGECRTLGLKVHQSFNVFGRELEALAHRSRVVLNLHFYTPGVFEYCRVIPMVHQNALVISEPSLSGEGAPLVAQCPALNIPDFVAQVCRDPIQLERLTFSQAERLTTSSRFATIVENALTKLERRTQ